MTALETQTRLDLLEAKVATLVDAVYTAASDRDNNDSSSGDEPTDAVSYIPVVDSEDSGTKPFDLEFNENGAKLVRCEFYHDGKLKTLEDADVSPSQGSVWLVMEEPGEDAEEGAEPTFSITQNEPGEDAKAIRLYDFDDEGNVSVDYRTAFVAFGDKSEEGGVKSLNEMDGDIEVVAGDGTVEVGEKPIRVVVEKKEGEGGKKIVISLSDEEDEEEEEEKEKEEHCNHPGTDEAGGVPAEGGGFGPGIGMDGGGVPAEGGTVHPGVSCNCD